MFRNIDLSEAWQLFVRLPVWVSLVALLLYNVSQWVSVWRVGLFYRLLGLDLSWGWQMRLYYVGMFYSLFIPGGIGGDAYKIYHLRKKGTVRTKSLVGVSLADRLNGLVAILLALGVLFGYTSLPYLWWAIVGLVLGAGLVSFGVWRWFGVAYAAWWPALGLSVLVQGCQLLCVGVLLYGWEVAPAELPLYGFVFLLSSLASVVPITLGGVGAREFTFLSMSGLLGIDAGVSVTLALLFFLIVAGSALLGGVLRV